MATVEWPRGGSEYGGLRGPIAPPPHDIADSPFEQASLAVRTNPDVVGDPLGSVEGVLAEEQKKVRP